jgi:ABC-2 type transport system permease protein
LALLACSSGAGIVETRRSIRAAETQARAERERWLRQGDKRPSLAGDQGIAVFQPISTLYAFDPGILPYVGSSRLLTADDETVFSAKPAEQSNSLRHLGRATPALIIQTLAPLMVVLLLFDVIAEERDTGTLRQLLATGAGSHEIVLGKLLGASVLLASLAVAAAVIVAGPILLSTSPSELTEALTRLIALGIVGTLYGFVWTLVVMCVSTAARSARQAILSLILIWFAASVAAPRVASDLAHRRAPGPSPFRLATSLIDAEARLPTLEELRADVRRRLLVQYGVQSLRDLPVDPIGVEMLETERLQIATVHPVFQQVYDALDRQANLVGRLGWFDPALAFQSLSMTLVGTDYEAHRRFVEAAEEYRRSFAHVLHLAVRDHPAYRTSPVFPGTDIIVTPGSPALWAQVPPFEYHRLSLGPTVARHLPEICSLVVWAAAAAVGLAFAAQHLARV